MTDETGAKYRKGQRVHFRTSSRSGLTEELTGKYHGTLKTTRGDWIEIELESARIVKARPALVRATD